MGHHFKIAISKNYQKLNVDLPKVSRKTGKKSYKIKSRIKSRIVVPSYLVDILDQTSQRG